MQSPPKRTSVKFSEEEARLLREVRDRLMDFGLSRLRTLTVTCPSCAARIDGASLSAERWVCRRCDYSQGGLRLAVDGTLSLGAVAGVGSLALLAWLSRPTAEPSVAPEQGVASGD